MFVKPVGGRAVRRPDTMRLLSADGETVPDTAFWLRAKVRGDVEDATPAQKVEVLPEADAVAQPIPENNEGHAE
ncbi:DUF2635 domain-containing protein [Gluconobacter cerinus]|uniref:DUF2635 domain-containing protein n=1 Tax=Gluconobacter cerinus TaxID=38307 RepID=A0AAV5NB91_9PROT|nr:DUF2635 domain-containing protein [Gluconobacter cerinus]GBR03137.1 hypothetical protein AA0229_1871 [Gluconobacter cerinus NRIC 0229]GLQ61551.1 hypothetical protein GCM10007867_03960 [Gluconobacter cerinus]